MKNSKFTTQKRAIELINDNSKKFISIKVKKILIVIFYASWGGHYNSIMPDQSSISLETDTRIRYDKID